MRFCWTLVLCILLHFTSISSTAILKELLQNRPPGIFGILTKPKVPKFPIGIQVGTQVGGGSFGFSFGFGVSKPTGGDSVPPKEDPPPNRPETSWEEKDKVGPRPNWEDDTINKPNWEEDTHKKPGWEEDTRDKPSSNKDKDGSIMEPYEENDDTRPSWDEIGEITDDERSEDLMDSDLVGDKIINPRKPRSKRRTNSKVYHIPLKFMSNARPFKVQLHSHSNSLAEEKYA